MKLNFKKLTILTLSALMIGGAGLVGYKVLTNLNNKYVDHGITLGNYTNIKMEFVNDTTYKLTAYIEPDNAGYKNVRWDLYWKNESSSFATGKYVEDYVSITQTSNDTLTVTLECLQAFGETIVVQVTSLDNEDVFATCDIDYGRKVEEVTALLNGVSTNGQTIQNNSLVELTADITYNEAYTYNTLYDPIYEYVPIENVDVDTVSVRGYYYLSKVNDYFESLLNTNKAFSQEDLVTYLNENVSSYGYTQSSYPYYGDISRGAVRELTQEEFLSKLNSTTFTFQVTVSGISDTITCKFNCLPSVSGVSLSSDSILF